MEADVTKINSVYGITELHNMSQEVQRLKISCQIESKCSLLEKEQSLPVHENI